jgi:hypothetical protein
MKIIQLPKHGFVVYNSHKKKIHIKLKGLTVCLKKKVYSGKWKNKNSKEKYVQKRKHLNKFNKTPLSIQTISGIRGGLITDSQCNKWVNKYLKSKTTKPYPKQAAAFRAIRFCLRQKWVPFACQPVSGCPLSKIGTRADMVWEIPNRKQKIVIELKQWNPFDFNTIQDRLWVPSWFKNNHPAIPYTHKNKALIQLAVTQQLLIRTHPEIYKTSSAYLVRTDHTSLEAWKLPMWASKFAVWWLNKLSSNTKT